MDYFQMVQRLQMTYDNKIILISCGAFYIAIGADAVTLNKELNLKVTCAKNGICKVGVLQTSIEKFSIGTEYKSSMYQMLKNVMYISKIDNKKECLKILNKIDAELNTKRIFLRIIQKQMDGFEKI